MCVTETEEVRAGWYNKNPNIIKPRSQCSKAAWRTDRPGTQALKLVNSTECSRSNETCNSRKCLQVRLQAHAHTHKLYTLRNDNKHQQDQEYYTNPSFTSNQAEMNAIYHQRNMQYCVPIGLTLLMQCVCVRVCVRMCGWGFLHVLVYL